MPYLDEEDVEILRQKVVDYYGTAMNLYPQAQINVDRALTADEADVINMVLEIVDDQYNKNDSSSRRGR